ncbi:MAG TPA: hypothetical protein VFS20_13860 [Longimicrobium sp.]|nr:hypothetical protein [Longimicrobium sp.]
MSRISLAAGLTAVLAGIVIAACRPAAPPPAAPAPTPAPAPRPAATWGVIDAYGGPQASLCVLQNGQLAIVQFDYNPSTGDSTVNGRPLREVYPVTAEYAAVARWYAMNEPITFAGRRYVKYGLPQVLGSSDVVRVGNVQGVSVFAEPYADARPYVIYLPVEVGCIFQSYQAGEVGAAVRG